MKEIKNYLMYIIIPFCGGILAACLVTRNSIIKTDAEISYAQDFLPFLSKNVMEMRSLNAYRDLYIYYLESGDNSRFEYLPYTLRMLEDSYCGFSYSPAISTFMSAGQNNNNGYNTLTKNTLSFLITRAIEEHQLDRQLFISKSYFYESTLSKKDPEFFDSLILQLRKDI